MSWLLRLSWLNGLRTGTKLAALCDGAGRVPSSSGKLYDPQRMQRLALMAGYEPGITDRVGPTSAEIALGALVEGYPMSRWNLRITADAGGRSHPHEQPMGICPSCLAQDLDPHWRREWALATSCRCQRHGTLLVDRCPHCGVRMAISLHRRRDLTACEACGQSQLRMVSRGGAKDSDPELHGCHSQPGESRPPFDLAYEHLYWDGVWWLLGYFCTKGVGVASLANTERAAVASMPLADTTAPFTKGLFVDRGPRERERLLALVRWILEDWPERTVRLLLSSRLSRTSFSARAADIGTRMPFWLEDVVDSRLNLRPYRPSRQEVLEAAAYLARSRRTPPSRKQLKGLLGVSESHEVAQAIPVITETLSTVAALKLLVAMNRLVVKTPCARAQRASVARDCLVIAACLAGSLKLGDAIGLTRSEFHELLNSQRTSKHRWRRQLYRYAFDWATTACPIQVSTQKATLPAFVTRFGQPYLGNAVPGLAVRVLRTIGFPTPERGIGVAKDLAAK